MFSVIGIVVLLLLIVRLQNNPEGWWLVGLVVTTIAFVIYSMNSTEKNRRAKAMGGMAKELRRLAEGFSPRVVGSSPTGPAVENPYKYRGFRH